LIFEALNTIKPIKSKFNLLQCNNIEKLIVDRMTKNNVSFANVFNLCLSLKTSDCFGCNDFNF